MMQGIHARLSPAVKCKDRIPTHDKIPFRIRILFM